jgi:Flp pilus assembly pilin Flp
MGKHMWNRLRSLHNDEQGADMVEYILIIAAVALPLLAALLYFWQDIKAWLEERLGDVKDMGDEEFEG